MCNINNSNGGSNNGSVNNHKAEVATTSAEAVVSSQHNNASKVVSLLPSPIGGWDKVSWTKIEQLHIPDPTRCFSILCLLIMFIRYGYTMDNDWYGAVNGLLLNKYFILYCTIATGTAYYANTTKKGQPLQIYDRWAAEWYYWNAWLYHAVMDGSSGSLRLIPVIVQQYDMLDLRFPTGHIVPYMIGMVELCIMAPLSLVTMYCIITQSTYRFPMELITSTFQLMGMIVFVVSEVYEGQVNIPALDPVGVPGNAWSNIKFLDPYHFVYYWFGFWFCNLIWGYVPYYRLHRAIFECKRAIDFYYNNHNIINNNENIIKNKKE